MADAPINTQDYSTSFYGYGAPLKGLQGPPGTPGERGEQGPQGIPGPGPTTSQLNEAASVALALNPPPKGDAATIRIGSVTTGEPGAMASVTNSGTSTDAILDISIPKGFKGDPGEAATVAIGTVNAGAEAAFVNRGTATNAVFDITLPQGPQGPQGVQGPPGDSTDAKTLGGQDGSYYVNIPARLGYTPVNKAGDNVTGTFVFGTAGGNRAEARASGDLLTRTGPDRGILRFGDSNARYIEYNESRFYFNECEIYSGLNNSLTWNAGNDGAGSGLDADLLDGRQASDFALLSGAQFQGNGTGVVGSGDWALFSLHNTQGSDSAIGNTSIESVNEHGIVVTSMQSLCDADGKSTIAFVTTPAGSRTADRRQTAAYIRGPGRPTDFYGSGMFLNGNTIWRGDNDGAGSALDADMLDGLHASDFVRLIGDDAQVPGTFTATRVLASSNGDGYALKIGDDAWLGDVNIANTVNIKGEADGSQGYLQFGGNGRRLGNTGNQTGLWYDGDFIAAGNVTAFSDRRLKSRIIRVRDALATVQKLAGVTYDKDGRRHIGLIAQNVQKHVPEAVHEGAEYLSVNYGGLTGLLVEAIRDLSNEVAAIKEQLA